MDFEYNIVQSAASFVIDLCRLFIKFRITQWIIFGVITAISWCMTALSSVIVLGIYKSHQH